MAASPKKIKLIRCGWNSDDPVYNTYHDEVWGRPQRDPRLLFEMLCLGGQQAGLSWINVLKKRKRYNRVFYEFDPKKISEMDTSKINELMNDAGIIRNRGKIASIISNAKAYQALENSGENFSDFIWSFVDNKPIINNWKSLKDIPTQSEQSAAMSRDLKKKKFKFVGPIICYAFMQTCGLVNDHIVDCFQCRIKPGGGPRLSTFWGPFTKYLSHTIRMISAKKRKLVRCGWLTEDTEYIAYHDEEWGRPQHDSQQLFEMLCLEGQQAGLSWITVLKKRQNYRNVFHNFEPNKISQMDSAEVKKLSDDTRIIRHRGKITAVINNAKSYIAMEKSGEHFSKFIWSFVEDKPIINNWKAPSDIPTLTERSIAMSQALKKRNFKFVGPTICYAFMQACGLVNDHIIDCFCHPKYKN